MLLKWFALSLSCHSWNPQIFHPLQPAFLVRNSPEAPKLSYLDLVISIHCCKENRENGWVLIGTEGLLALPGACLEMRDHEAVTQSTVPWGCLPQLCSLLLPQYSQTSKSNLQSSWYLLSMPHGSDPVPAPARVLEDATALLPHLPWNICSLYPLS